MAAGSLAENPAALNDVALFVTPDVTDVASVTIPLDAAAGASRHGEPAGRLSEFKARRIVIAERAPTESPCFIIATSRAVRL
ncbi:hypothetical protein [Elioraea sp.]|uniref:hypothetical protein n=1 Tax=Elioraea sp. TaxID=2185103 RepID=UPI00307E56F5